MAIPNNTRNANGLYGPTINNQFYKPKPDHGINAGYSPHKTRWCIGEGQEYSVFRPAEEGNWYNHTRACLFGFYFEDGVLVQIGKDQEYIAKFPAPNNNGDPWHGYPVKTSEKFNRPSSELLDDWDEKIQEIWGEEVAKKFYKFRRKIELGQL